MRQAVDDAVVLVLFVPPLARREVVQCRLDQRYFEIILFHHRVAPPHGPLAGSGVGVPAPEIQAIDIFPDVEFFLHGALKQRLDETVDTLDSLKFLFQPLSTGQAVFQRVAQCSMLRFIQTVGRDVLLGRRYDTQPANPSGQSLDDEVVLIGLLHGQRIGSWRLFLAGCSHVVAPRADQKSRH
ncbi:hypothetical protein D3C71_1271170 [compost metagenome]